MNKKILALCAAGLLLSMTGCEEKMDPNDPPLRGFPCGV